MNDYFHYVLVDMISRELGDPDRVPFHEAGHAVMAHYHRFKVLGATVKPNYFPDDPDDLYIGQVRWELPWPDDDEATISVWQSRARVLVEVAMAGRASEIECFGVSEPLNDDDYFGDLESVRQLLRELYSLKTDAQVHAYIERAEMKSRQVLKRHWPVVARLAGELKEHRTLDEESLLTILQDVPQRTRWESDKRWAKCNDSESEECYRPVE